MLKWSNGDFNFYLLCFFKSAQRLAPGHSSIAKDSYLLIKSPAKMLADGFAVVRDDGNFHILVFSIR